jgi:hypothetical protein
MLTNKFVEYFSYLIVGLKYFQAVTSFKGLIFRVINSLILLSLGLLLLGRLLFLN